MLQAVPVLPAIAPQRLAKPIDALGDCFVECRRPVAGEDIKYVVTVNYSEFFVTVVAGHVGLAVVGLRGHDVIAFTNDHLQGLGEMGDRRNRIGDVQTLEEVDYLPGWRFVAGTSQHRIC